MATILAKCSNPACGAEGAVPEEYSGRKVKCSKCGISFTISAPPGDAMPAMPAETADEPQNTRGASGVKAAALLAAAQAALISCQRMLPRIWHNALVTKAAQACSAAYTQASLAIHRQVANFRQRGLPSWRSQSSRTLQSVQSRFRPGGQRTTPAPAPPAPRGVAALSSFNVMDLLRTLPADIANGTAAILQQNRLLSYCLLIAFGGHLVFAGVMWGITHLPQTKHEETRIKIAIYHQLEEPKPKVLPKTLDVPLGQITGKVNAKMAKGTTLKDRSHQPNGRVLTSGPLTDAGDVPVVPDKLLNGSGIATSDVPTAADHPGNFGTAEGTGNEIPAGFENGKVGGRVYFIRLKHGSGAWDNHADGTRNLLKFLGKYIPCQTDTWPMATRELQDKYLSNGSAPRFIYIFADENFKLSTEDIAVLRDYMNKDDGFLFIDSAADQVTKDHVSHELDRLLPGLPLTPISKANSINYFLFKIQNPPATGSNYGGVNYGVTKDNRLVVFYTMGCFGAFYENSPYDDAGLSPASRDISNAQYQMSANVIEYAISKGVATGIGSLKGANAAVTKGVVEELLKAFGGSTGGGGKDHNSKIPPPNGDSPVDVNVVD